MEQTVTCASIDWPIGTPEERLAAHGSIPGDWENANPFGNWYEIAKGTWNWHTGIDLNLNTPTWNADWHKPVCAMADGKVVFAGAGGGSWGHIIVCQHIDPLTGRAYFSRFGHIENPKVKAGDVLTPGQPIAQVGNGDGIYGQTGAHLHLDICVTDLLLRYPNQWPGTNQAQVLANYVDPVEFIGTRYRATQNAGTFAALQAAMAKLPETTPITLILGGLSIPGQIYILQAKDLGFASLPGDSIPPTESTPPDAPPPLPIQTMYVTATDGLNVRRMPAPSSESVGVLPYGTSVGVVESDTPGWVKIVAQQPDTMLGTYLSSKWLSSVRVL